MWVGEELILKLHFFSHSWTWFYCIIISSSSTTISPLRDMCVHIGFRFFAFRLLITNTFSQIDFAHTPNLPLIFLFITR